MPKVTNLLFYCKML